MSLEDGVGVQGSHALHPSLLPLTLQGQTQGSARKPPGSVSMVESAMARRSLAVANGTFPELPWPSEMPSGEMSYNNVRVRRPRA